MSKRNRGKKYVAKSGGRAVEESQRGYRFGLALETPEQTARRAREWAAIKRAIGRMKKDEGEGE